MADWMGSLILVSMTGILLGKIREKRTNTKHIHAIVKNIIIHIFILILIFAMHADRYK